MTAEQATPNEETQERMPVNRREFLNFAWLVSMGFLTISVAGVTYLFALPRFKEGEFGGVITVGTVESLPTVSDPPDNYAKTKFWLSNNTEGLIALYKVCTHLGCLYNWNEQEIKFICPCHGSQFQRWGLTFKDLHHEIWIDSSSASKLQMEKSSLKLIYQLAIRFLYLMIQARSLKLIPVRASLANATHKFCCGFLISSSGKIYA